MKVKVGDRIATAPGGHVATVSRVDGPNWVVVRWEESGTESGFKGIATGYWKKLPKRGGRRTSTKRKRSYSSRRKTTARSKSSRAKKRRTLTRLRRVRIAARSRGWGVRRGKGRWATMKGLTTSDVATRGIPSVGMEWRTQVPPGSRFQKGGDLYKKPMTRARMLSPLAEQEKHMATVYRYGELDDGTLGMRRVK